MNYSDNYPPTLPNDSEPGVFPGLCQGAAHISNGFFLDSSLYVSVVPSTFPEYLTY